MPAINRGLEECGIFLLLLTEAAVRSQWVQHETNAAIALDAQQKMRVLPLEVEPVSAPPLWSGYQWIRFRSLSSQNMDRLLTALEEGSTPPPPPPPVLEPDRPDPDPVEPGRSSQTGPASPHPRCRFPAGYRGLWARLLLCCSVLGSIAGG